MLNSRDYELVVLGGGEKSPQAIATRTVSFGAASTWQCGQSRQAVVANFVSLRRLALGGTYPPLGDLAPVSPSYWTL